MAEPWDVIIVGAGTAGMPAAIFAAQRGARVLVLEDEVVYMDATQVDHKPVLTP